jgi:hypothetical protein
MTRRGKQIVPATWWNGRNATRSTGPGLVNLKVSWIAFPFSTPRESIRHETMTDSKVLQMRYSRRPRRPIKRKKFEEPKVNFPRAHKEVNYIYDGPKSYEPRRK